MEPSRKQSYVPSVRNVAAQGRAHIDPKGGFTPCPFIKHRDIQILLSVQKWQIMVELKGKREICKEGKKRRVGETTFNVGQFRIAAN